MVLRIFFALFALSLSTNATSAPLRVLIFQHGFSPSHLRFAEALARILHEHGHVVDELVIVLNPSLHAKNERILRRLHWVKVDDEKNSFLKMKHMINPFEDEKNSFFEKHDVQLLSDALRTFCAATIEDEARMRELRAARYDIVVTSAYSMCPYALARLLDVTSVVGFVATSGSVDIYRLIGIPLPPSLYSAYFPNTFDHTSFFGRLTNFFRFANSLRYDLLEAEVVYFAARHPRLPSSDALFSDMCFLLVNTDEIIDIAHPSSSKVKFVGGIAAEIAAQQPPLHADLEKALNIPSSKGVVLMSFGSLFKTTHIPASKKMAIIEAFAHFHDYTFIWKYDDIDEDAQLFANATNIFRFKWLPQTVVLIHERVRAFITHMGQNSYLELSAAGVPAIAIPIFADQTYNADAAFRNGVAVVVDKLTLNRDNLIRAVETILTDTSYGKKAREIARMIAQKPGRIDAAGFVDIVAYAAAFSRLGTDVLKMTTSSLSQFELYAYDIVLFLVGCMAVAVATLVYAAKIFARLALRPRLRRRRQNLKKNR